MMMEGFEAMGNTISFRFKKFIMMTEWKTDGKGVKLKNRDDT